MVGREREGLSLDAVRVCLFMIPVLGGGGEGGGRGGDRAEDSPDADTRLGRRRCMSGRKSLLGLQPLSLVCSEGMPSSLSASLSLLRQ